ncbi:LysR family transcriptional regulator [Streptomyces sudanensis]|uniref:LysR family transcriptional regulator n=1 Tax=Streptomyces sudanensis TaxID=436397 RepID=UPI0020CC744A|nr:LysR family transcriptional regulator [Streptomyces sudanensis]MCP9987310.1 LysR family transcriptional regulator [Streptomyces sudanensis]MCQ0001293.1 LysR family transcriptional regulator [Streptomyces sudanensis]
MDLSLLRTFVTVCRAGSFTRAAALLGLSQPAVTSQIRSLEKQLGRPLFLRQARGVTPTTVGEELAHRAAPHLDALVEIAETGPYGRVGTRTLHLAGPPEIVSLRALPALTPLTTEGLTLRTSLSTVSEENLDGLAAGRHDLVVSTTRPGGGLTATPLCDEEHVLVAAPCWAARLAPDALREGPAVLDRWPVIEVHESLPFVARYWSAVFESRPVASATVIVPDLRAALESAASGAGLTVLPRYLCEEALGNGRLVALLDPPVPPLRTYFLVARAGTLVLPHIAKAQETLLRAATEW